MRRRDRLFFLRAGDSASPISYSSVASSCRLCCCNFAALGELPAILFSGNFRRMALLYDAGSTVFVFRCAIPTPSGLIESGDTRWFPRCLSWRQRCCCTTRLREISYIGIWVPGHHCRRSDFLRFFLATPNQLLNHDAGNTVFSGSSIMVLLGLLKDTPPGTFTLPFSRNVKPPPGAHSPGSGSLFLESMNVNTCRFSVRGFCRSANSIGAR